MQGNVQFQYNMKAGTYTEYLGNPTGNIFLAASRDHDFLLCHKSNTSNVLIILKNLIKTNLFKNSINLIKITSSIPRDPLHPNYYAKKRDPKAKYSDIIKRALRNCKKGINFAVPVQNEEGTQTSNDKISSKAQYISNEYNV